MIEVDDDSRGKIVFRLVKDAKLWHGSTRDSYLIGRVSNSGARLTLSEVGEEKYFGPQLADSDSASAYLRDLARRLKSYYHETPNGRKSPYLIQLLRTRANRYRLSVTRKTAAKSPIKIFLCHSSGDKRAIRKLYTRLAEDRFSPWLDEKVLLPGEDWESEIKKAVRRSDIVLVCLSPSSVTKSGFVQKEILFALDVADEKPEGTAYIIPVLLKPCSVPERLRRWQRIDLFKPLGYDKLVIALNAVEPKIERADKRRPRRG